MTATTTCYNYALAFNDATDTLYEVFVGDVYEGGSGSNNQLTYFNTDLSGSFRKQGDRQLLPPFKTVCVEVSDASGATLSFPGEFTLSVLVGVWFLVFFSVAALVKKLT